MTSVENVVSLLASEPEFNEHQAMMIYMVTSRVGLVIMSNSEVQAMKDRMDVCPGHPISEFVR